jgi:restriction system protein
MGYRDRDEEPYQKLDRQWRDYGDRLKMLEELLPQIFYDGYETNFVADERGLEARKLSVTKEQEEERNVFLLPRPIPVLSLEDVLTTLPPPPLPRMGTEPAPLTLDRSEYPSWFLNTDTRLYEFTRDSHLRTLERSKAYEERRAEKERKLLPSYEEAKRETSAALSELPSSSAGAITRLTKIANLRHPLPRFFRKRFDAFYDAQARLLLIEFEFPDFARENFVIGRANSRPYKPKYASAAQKRKTVKRILYSLIVRNLYLAAKFLPRFTAESVVVNVQQNWFDLATGQPRSGIIATVQASVDYLLSIDPAKLDPEACIRNLKGIVTSSLETINAVRPIFVLNKDDDRLVAGKDVGATLDQESNLAAMAWEDFEHLVAQLLEWEFGKSGVEVRVTRASRDRGVDAILFDPDPLRGGKFVLQAKRYTRTVDVSAVRDLYGTVMNEGANRGILVCTSSYGPDAYEFAKDKPISLVDGPHLLSLFQKHGKKYKIDLDEARRLQGDLG